MLQRSQNSASGIGRHIKPATSISRIFCTLCLSLFRGVLQYVSESGDGKLKPIDVLVCPAASDSSRDSILLRT